MPVHNAEIADKFERLADLLELEDANPFRVRAYRNAARTLRGYPEPMAALVARGADLSELPNVGDDLAAKIATIVESGELPLLAEVEARVPGQLSDLMRIEGLGPKRVKALYRELDIRTADDLRRAATAGRIRSLSGFGAKTEQKILRGLGTLAAASTRVALPEAEETARTLVAWLEEAKGIGELHVAGSYRRRQDTVGDLDVLVTAGKGAKAVARFVAYDEVEDVISAGDKRSTVRLRSGLQVDLRVVPKVSRGAALLYFTGSKAHNIALRMLAVAKGWKLNEYGLFEGEKRIAGATEKSVYRRLGLPWIPPELREDRGEIAAARKGRLPKLVEIEDLRGDLHCHTTATDGRLGVEGMARAAAKLGYEYLSINDHSRHVTVAHGLDADGLLAQIDEIDRLNEKLDRITILKSVEVDILEDGRLDLPDDVLARLDFTVGAVHYRLDLPEKKQTERILRAMDNPHFNVLAHPTGRLINQRPPYAVDLPRLMAAAAERGVAMEVNAQPSRLDLNDDGCRLAREAGVKVVISTDAHDAADLRYLRYGVDQARRAWLTKEDVLNTLGLRALRKALKRDG
jgi:DNA polymerase (family 10)